MRRMAWGVVLLAASILPAFGESSERGAGHWKVEPVPTINGTSCAMSFIEHRRGSARLSRNVILIAGTSIRMVISDMERGTREFPGHTLTLTLDEHERSMILLPDPNRDLFAAGIIATGENMEAFLHDFAQARRGMIQSPNGLWLLNMQGSGAAVRSLRSCMERYGSRLEASGTRSDPGAQLVR